MTKKIKFTIRDFSIEDFADINELWRLTGQGGAHRGDTTEIVEKTILNGGKLLVMIESVTKKIIGTSWVTNDHRRLYLHHFGILPEYQGKGLSKPLLVETMKFIKKTGLQVKLEVHRDNAKAANVYQKHGFKYLGDYDVYIIRNVNTLETKIKTEKK